MTTSDACDIAVVGGGIVGSAIGYGLATIFGKNLEHS